jgi:Asp-tRNA(Asn)/Glu-tRNA(Gln) amidotransferase A subunit family amidase
VTELNRLSALDAARQIAAGKISSEALVQACLERVRAREPEVRAWAYHDPDAVLAQARAIDQAAPRGLLAGIPVAVKDVIDTADLPTQYNSPIYRNFRPRADAACVALARGEGAIVFGKSVTTEFASRTPGPTRNPHNLEHTPGGSSSGSAAAVADFMVPFGFGTQTGGSVIRPASFCGVVGYKPSFGTINCAGLKHLSESLDTIGVIARTVADCALLVNATSGRAMPGFSATLQAPRIGVWRTSRSDKASSATLELIERSASTLARRGAVVNEFTLPAEFDRLYDDQPLISGFDAARALAWEYKQHPELLSDHMREQIALHAAKPRQPYTEAVQRARQRRQQFTQLVADAGIDAVLTISAPGEALKGITSTGNALFNRNWTLLGVPCITLPAGYGPQGLPLGVQLVADYDADEQLLLCAEWVRNALG